MTTSWGEPQSHNRLGTKHLERLCLLVLTLSHWNDVICNLLRLRRTPWLAPRMEPRRAAPSGWQAVAPQTRTEGGTPDPLQHTGTPSLGSAHAWPHLSALRGRGASLTKGLWGPASSTAQQHLLTSCLCVTFRQFLQYFKLFHTYICYGDQRLPVTENSDDGQDLLAKSNFNEGTYIVFLDKMPLHT